MTCVDQYPAPHRSVSICAQDGRVVAGGCATADLLVARWHVPDAVAPAVVVSTAFVNTARKIDWLLEVIFTAWTATIIRSEPAAA